MDQEAERVLYLSRVGREKIFKYGTYTVTQQRPITQDHPFYAKRDDEDSAASEQFADEAAEPMSTAPEPASALPEPEEEDDPEVLAAQMISSNFKVGLSQDEVDALLNGMA